MWRNRVEAGQALGERLKTLVGPDAVILGIPRGGVIVAAEAANILGAGLDVLVTRKISAPGNPELGIGAIAPDGQATIDEAMLGYLSVTDDYLKKEKAGQLKELHRRESLYRDGAPAPDWSGQTLVIVDDGVATGGTIKAAALYARRRGAKRVIVAAPVAPQDVAERLGESADEYVFLETPAFFSAVGAFFEDFNQTTDEEVRSAMGYK